MAPDQPIKLTAEQAKSMLDYTNSVYRFLGGSDVSLRHNLEYRDKVYYRELDQTTQHHRAKNANKQGDATRMQNVTVPVVAPQVETAAGYLTEVFLTGEPFFGVVTPKASLDAGLQMETIISDNSRRFGWRGEFMKTFRDGLKYNIMGIEMAWEVKKVFSIINDPMKAEKDAGVATEDSYAGNFAKRIDLYNAIIDTRVAPNKVHSEGEFGGYVELKTRTAMKQLILDLGTGNTMNVTEALGSSCNTHTAGEAEPGHFYIPLINPDAIINPANIQHNWLSWALNTKNGIEYKDLYEVATIYCRFMPSDFRLALPSANTPQIFKLIIVNQKWILFCKRMTNAHNFLPTVFGQPFDDGLGYQAKSFADNVTPYQDMASSLWNSGIESKRKLVYDRLFYDPSRISKVDIDKAGAVARIPVKAAGYGKPVQDAVWSATYRDDNVLGVLQMAQSIQSMAKEANGQNNVQQGQFQKGNKTRGEFDTTMHNSNTRPRMFAISLEDQFFAPIKEIVKMNITQYQPAKTVYNHQTKEEVSINPQDLRKAAIDFKLSDGQTPTEKLLNSELMTNVAQIGMAIPQVAAQYDIVGMLIHQWKQNGAWWLEDYKRTPEEMAQYMQMTAQTADANAPSKDRQTPGAAAEQAAQAQAANSPPATSS
jgi:hypothetical protein